MKAARMGLLLVVGASAVVASCGGGMVRDGPVRLRHLSELTADGKAALAAARIYFGHQSVGSNVMTGITDLVREDRQLALNVVELDAGPLPPGGFFAHGMVGQNGQPAGKTHDFAVRVEKELAGLVDVAFHKYCYIDINDGTDIRALFTRYRETMARVRAAHPSVTFVHVTVPLTHVQYGPKVLVKKLLGKAPGGYAENLRREEFNDLLRGEYLGREPLFDLAAVEATRPDGLQESFWFKGTSGRALYPPYGSDGRHLNETGRRRVAEELLVFLAGVLRQHTAGGAGF